MDHLSKSRKQNYEVGPRGSDLNQLGATQMNDSKDYGFDWIDNDTYDWDSSRREEFKMAKRETTKGWNAYGATLLDDDGRQIRDNVGRTVRENLGASRRVDLGTTGETRVEDTPDFFGRTNYGGRDQYSPEPTVSANDEPLPPVKERILYPSTEPYNYAVDDGFETADGKQRRWTSVAADKTLMRQWHDMFGRIRTKWSSNSGFDSRVSNMSYDQSSSDKQDDYNKWARLQRPVLIGVAVFIVLSVAVLVPVIILTGSKDNQTKEVLLQYEYEARISNRIYSEDMANSSSEAFTTVAEEFCDLMDANAENKTNEEFSYQGCVVTEITNGSLVIRYTLIVLSVTTPTADQVSNVVGIVISLDQQEIGDFTITLIESLSEAVVINEENNPVRKKVQFNTTCSVSKNERCVTKYSECIDNVCSCTVIRYYDNTTDECTLIDCGEVPAIDNGNVTENGSRYGSVPLITCKHGYELSDNATVNCSSHGSWGHLPSCEPVKCQEFITPNYSDVNTNTTGRVFEDRIEITCTEGYILNGNISSVDCQADRSWSMSPECIPRTCEQFQNPKHSKILPSKLQFVYNENINVECDEGYQLVGNETLSCLANGTWIEKPTCEPVNCELLPTLDFAIVPKNEKQYVYNETVTIVCKAGYKLDRNESVSCQANSSWTDLPSCTPIECNEFIQPENSDIELNKTGYRYSDLIEVTCQSGYTFIGKNNLSCNTDGTWPKIYCAKINCTEDFVRLEHSIVTEWNESTLTFEIGCEDGYEIVGEPSVTCLNNGTWSIAPTCNAKDCRNPSEIPNAAPIDINSTTFNSKFSVECNEGFNSSDLLTVTCQSDGTWSKFPTCNIISCGNVTVPEFATVTVKEGDTYGKNVKFECIEGYELIGNSEIKCQQNSSWTSYPVCQIKDCGEIKTISDGEVFNETGTTFGSVIYIKCNEGFDIVGKDVVTCLSSGRWEILPSCLKTDCGNYSPPEHTNVGPNNTLSCDIGYEIIQNDTVECIGGNWSDIEGCKPVKCNSFPIIDNANTSKTEEGPYVFGDTVEILCDDGFEITGSSEANCGANKTWENVPKCDRIICQDFSIPNNAVIGEQKTKNRVFEDEIFVNCSEGYSLKGNNSAICGANKEWLNIPKCDPIVCEELQIQNSLNQLNNVQYKYNENATIICISGYSLEGVETLKCSENGTWIHKPTCIPKHCVPIEILNAELQPNKTDYMFNESITVICISGYMLNGNDSISCLENGTWINIPSCTPVSCEHLIIPNATLKPDKLQFMYNDSVSLKCNSGYTLEGKDTLNCLENGSWTNIPSCTPITCGQPTIPNAKIIPNKPEYVYNESVFVLCNKGYMVENNDTTLKCLENRIWEDYPTCKPVECPVFTLPDKASILLEKDKYMFNDNVTLTCDTGYDIEGDSTINCQVNSSWTALPDCKPIECNDFIQPENSDIELNKTGYRYGDRIEVTCQSGYTLIGRHNLSCNTDGTWPSVYCAKINCTENLVQLENSIVIEWSESTSTFEIGCKDGYDIVGDSSVTCLNNGTWSISPACKAKDCGNPTEIPNAVSIGLNSTTFNNSFFVDCNEGYFSLDHFVVTCQSNGTWSKFPTCDLVSCGNYTVPKFARVSVEGGNTYGKNVTFECIEGYELIGNSEIKCQQNSSWTSYPVCRIKDCGEIKTISDGEVYNQTGTTFGSVIHIKCNEGFDIVGKDIVTCLSSGRWEILPSCLKTDCGNYFPPEHTYVGPNNTLSCDIGYEIIQNDTVECIGGNWSDIEGCKPVKCNSFPNIDNANTSKSEERTYVFGDTVEILCDDGFEITGSSEATCGANKTWENVPKCDRIICQDFSIPNNAVIGEQKTKNRVFEDEIFVNCSDGYSLKGNNSAICGANKEWLNIPKCDPIVCEDLQIQNSLNQLNNVQYKYNENATITCISGYILEGVKTLKCSENGTWIHKPTCIPKHCEPIEILNAELQPNKTDYMYNESITVICISGYMLTGNDSISCLENGTWINIPSCTPVSCKNLIVPNATLKPDKLQFMYNESVGVKCRSGYTLEGEDTLNCFENGSWANIPICTPVLCDLLLIENADVSPEKTNYTYNENVTVQCMEGFQLEGNEVNRCNESGTWINAPLCIPVRCEQPNIQNAVIRPNKTEYTYKENVTVVCDFGYTLKGDEIVYCAANRTWAIVSICIPVECKLFTLPENAFFSIKQEKYVYNDNITIECMDGYELEGDGTTKCQANSSWTVLPICKPITCEPLQLPDYAKTDTNFTVLNFEDEISVGCKSGFILIGFNNISCDANGTWPDIICVEVNCSTDNIFKPENSVMYMNETVSSFEIECIEGYQIVGNSSVTCLDGTWSQIPTCEIVNCGNYIPTNNTFVVSSNTETTYNSSQNITCIAGLEFTNDSARVITCGANGQWNGVPVCSITGEVSFTEDRYSLIEGADEAIVCDVKDYPGWQTVIVAKLNVMNSSSFTPIAQIYHENESVVETLDGNYTITASFKTDGVSLTVTFQKAECDDEGVYICAAIVGDPKEPIQMKQTRTNVSVSCSDGCGEFIPGADISFDLVQSNITTPINTSVPVQCIVGLEFTNDSTTYLTCGADRQWVGQPECKIPGKLLFTQTAYSFETGDTEMIICEVTNYSSWQKVLLAKQTNQTDEQASPIALVTNEDDSFPVVNVLDDSYHVNATTREDGVTVSIVLSPAACASEGIYLCAAVVGDEENPIDSVFTETHVTIMSESHSPDIKIPAMVYLGREAHVDCTGRIGKGPTGEHKGYLLMITNFGDNGSIALYNGSDSPSIEGCYYRDAISVPIPTESSGSYLWAKCIIRHFNGTELESEQRNISVQDSFVSFEKMSYLFNIGEKASFVCEVENILDFDRIEIMSGGRLVTALNTSDMAVEAADSRISILANETSILNSSAKVVVMFDLTECSDTPEDMVDDVEYACAVLSGSETVEGKTVVTFQRPPFVPELTLSHQIIEGQDTWKDRTFQCEGEIGDPEGTIEVESDFDGEFSTFLAPSKGLIDTSFGFLVSNVTMKTQCGYNATLAFALKNISRDHMHLKNLRCVTIPSDKIVNGRLMYSEQKVIKVVPGDYCEGVTTLTYKPHPFYCNSAVACNDKSIGVNVCEMDECADTQDDTTYKCSSCESVTDSCRAKGVQCYQTSKTAYKGDSITFTCNTQDFGKVAIISVNNGAIVDVDNEDESIEVMEDVIVTVGQYHISLGFTNVSCEQEGEYVIKLNNETDVALSLKVISDPDDPVISLPMVIKANEETRINCSGKVGRDVEGKKKTAIHLEFSSPDFGSFEFGENTRDYVDNNCEIFEMVSFNVLPDVNWNNSHVRCVTLQESAVVASSPSQQLILEVPELFCQPLTAKSEIGGSVTFTCALKDVSVISNVIISKDGNELLDADNETVPFEGYNDGITLAIPSNAELNINFPNVTCEQEGVYQIGVNQGLSSQQTLRVISPAMEPSLNTSSVGRINELFEISCSGYIGRDEEGNAASSLYLETKTGEESGFSVISNVTRESAVEDNCQYFEAIHMTFFTDISWNNTSVRCVARNESAIITESSTKHIQVESPNTYFENTDLTGIVGDSLILTCVVNQMEGLSDIKISRGADRTTIASYLSTPNSEVVVVIDEESGINGSAGFFKINLTLQCGDEGMYYCMPSGSGPTTEAVTTIHLQRKPGIPELKMSREIIENKYTLSGRLFYCEGDIGDPAGTIEIQSNFNGSFQTFLSPENGLRENSIGWIVSDVTNSTSCKNFRSIGFAFHNITMEMQSKTLRCVIHPAKNTSVSPQDVFDEKPIYIIPDDYCVGESEYKPHPYFCHLRVQCSISDGTIKGVPEGCKEYECFNENSCVNCSTIGGCNITGPTTTTATTTPSPDSKYLDSEDLLTGENGENAQLRCNLYNIDIDHSNLTDNPVSVEADNGLGLIFESSRDSLSDSNTFVTSVGVEVSLGTNSVTLRFEPLQCKHVGKYTFRYAALETISQIDITANVSTPTISREPENFHKNQQVSLRCTGDVGRPKGDLVLQVKTQKGDNWQEIPGDTKTEEETSNCTTLMTLDYMFYVDETHDGNQYRCKSEGNEGGSLNSSIVVAEVIDSVVYFTEAGVTAEIGSDVELQCILGGFLANSHVVISRKTINKEENICTMKSLDTIECSPAHISGNATLSESDRVVTINIDAAECDDEGTYFCASVNDTSFQTSINVSLTKSPAWKPTLSLPIRMVLSFLETFSSISCNADVGYPPGDLRLEYSRDNNTSYSTLDIGTAGAPVENKEDCSVNKSISYSSYTYTQSWNNTSVRCAVYGSTNASDAPLIVSDVQTISLIVNECPSEGIFYMNHPLNCHYLITCLHGSPIVGNDCRSNCPNIVSNTTPPHCDGNCTMLALTTGCIVSLD